MLQHLLIENFALMERAELEFGEGFIVLTGETGAGKSVLLGALQFLSGAKAPKTVIRQGAEKAVVEGAFYVEEPEGLNALLEELGLPLCEDGVLLLKRELAQKKMPKISINGGMATLSGLQQVGEWWLDFHGPGEPQKLFRDRVQLNLLDQFAGLGEQREAYERDYREWRLIIEEREALEKGERLTEEELEFWSGQLKKMEGLTLEEEALAELEKDYNRLSDAQNIKEWTHSLSYGLSGNNGVMDQIGKLLKDGGHLAEVDDEASQLYERLQALSIEADDLAQCYEDIGQSLNLQPSEVAAIQDQWHLWLSLKRKHGGTLEGVLAKKQSLETKINQQGDVEGTLLKLEKKAADLEAKLLQAAKQMTEKRKKAALKLGKEVEGLLVELGFKKAKFKIEVTMQKTLSDTGNSRSEMQFAPNAGQDLMPLSKIASSGEMARVMLGLKAVLVASERTPVLVFDEVDANVGGEIGRVVGEKLKRLAHGHQVFCVTHLPQVASQGNLHYLVEKEQGDSHTEVSIEAIHPDKKRRQKELARMLGDRESAVALKHAAVLLGE